MIVLGIESTAHTFGVGILNDRGEILANVKHAYTTEKGGIHPVKAAEHHITHAFSLVKTALRRAHLSMDAVDVIAFSQAPGLGPTLKIGHTMACILALKHTLPLVGVHHCIAHLEIGRLRSGYDDPILLYTSGVNTQLITFQGGTYRTIGETLDMGIGNLLDKFARDLNLGFPGGPHIERLAKQSTQLIELPYTIKGMDVSYGGLYTHVRRLIGRHAKESLCYSLQEYAFAVLIEATERALAQSQKTALVLGGGVACNTRLQEMARIMCQERGAQFSCPRNELLVDNGAMIAWLGVLMAKKRIFVDPNTSRVDPYVRTDEVPACWR